MEGDPKVSRRYFRSAALMHLESSSFDLLSYPSVLCIVFR